ncbi:MAG: hypothetical protein EBT03_08045 [Betaproteobacteria bacterium]|nr:hypothetical protein [Betaproteobacteria bacterium]NCA16921.1 hypothetical protein [Betaproteobacteria bacterium]
MIRILVAVDRDRRTAATQIYEEKTEASKRLLRGMYKFDNESIQYRIVETDVPDWQEPTVPVVKCEAKEVTP